ncbi:Cd(II)/Pb(II)-responsive transcriptional regulator [Comamonas sp. JUb58]|uniref:Cd(II)/Pb(II)-responsive transcriptional regulator n=1 Tax=Comamonas sp. JUb58 TaxID=2485114 RepID=UPI00105FBC38|nr:Cd(II)/Pb(II)-responsive transcriptional regulator [Comamonas sp. JUb58]TDS84467.1 Cd(II)/Pb(II)-responsive transcriptional regulator [Comamonas sp. JUb58]
MKIGELATASATPVETIRYYEREGLLPQPTRTASNYRVYEEQHLERLQFIRNCRGLQMSLDEVRELLRYKDEPAQDCAETVDKLIEAHIGHVALRIQELRGLEAQLIALRDRCRGSQDVEHCGILAGLAETPATPAVKQHLHVR